MKEYIVIFLLHILDLSHIYIKENPRNITK
jgi:hypothetical protein